MSKFSESSLHEMCLSLDREIEQEPRLKRMGSTAVFTVWTPQPNGTHTLVTCTVGDSEAMGIAPDGTCRMISKARGPEEKSEKRRIESAGGYVSSSGRVRQHEYSRHLGLSRAFGDHDFKNKHLPQEEQIITPQPEITVGV
eukprot:GDKI01013556.1.p1 GENE.GDKI01013556.1~~GDKI01013556.1.p1  ORF type:complete len:141 (+),score=22.47 GDKI01013556.1:349-771(+)